MLEQMCLARSTSVEPIAGADHRPTLLSLKEDNESIIVLLAEGFDGVLVRSVLEQVKKTIQKTSVFLLQTDRNQRCTVCKTRA